MHTHQQAQSAEQRRPTFSAQRSLSYKYARCSDAKAIVCCRGCILADEQHKTQDGGLKKCTGRIVDGVGWLDRQLQVREHRRLYHPQVAVIS